MLMDGEIMSAVNVLNKEITNLDRIIHNIIGNMLLICQVSPKGKYEYINNTHYSILGYKPEDLVDKSMFEFIHPEDLVMVQTLFMTGLISGQFKPMKLRFRCNNKKYIYLESQGIVIYDDLGHVKGAVFVTRDITEHTMIENELARIEQLKTIGQLSAGLVHEIRNPLTTVRGFLQFLGSHEELKSYVKYFDLMIRELDGANHLINDFLTMAKENETNFSWQNLNHLIQTLYPVLSNEAQQNNHKIELELGDINEIYMDGNQIRQLIVNLVNNGLEAMEQDGVITIKTYAQGENIILSVEDQGAGIDCEIMDRIGTPFFTTKAHGTGLGLSICKNIAARHEAEIHIKSSQEGSIFSVCFKDFKGINYHYSIN
jgi:PAS domain S-box-containing protein